MCNTNLGVWSHAPQFYLCSRDFPCPLHEHLRNTQKIHDLLQSTTPLWPGTYRWYGRPIGHVLSETSNILDMIRQQR